MNNRWHSLRFRYMVSVVILIILVFIGAYIAHLSTQYAQTEATMRFTAQQEFNEQTREIRNRVLESYTNIDAYLLDPSHKEYKSNALNSLDTAIGLSMHFQQSEKNPVDTIKSLHQQKLVKLLQKLRIQTEKLFLSREDVALQYPSMSVGNRVMQPNRNNFNNAIAVALNELKEERIYKIKPDLYAEFIEVRYLWTQMLSNFRLYLANRMGSFNVDSLPIQEKAIETMYQELNERLRKLQKRDEKQTLSFQASIAVDDMITAGEGWHDGFVSVVKIHSVDGWRTDSSIMKQDIVPLINQVSGLFSETDNLMTQKTSGDMNLLIRSTKRQTQLLLWGTVAIVVCLLIIYVSTEHMVFRPVATVVRALKAEAIGKDGIVLPSIRSEEIVSLVNAFNEMASRVHRRQSDLEYQALHDALTALPNRTLLQERMAHHIQVARREHRQLSLLMIDLDRFKDINDTLGHHVGDKVLIEVGSRISMCLREVDTVARLGGDEFAVILPDTDTSQAIQVAEKLLTVLQNDFHVDELNLHMGMSVGISVYPEHGSDVSTIIQHADVAMYVAKHNQSGFSVYDANKDEYSIRRLELINDLRSAIEQDQLDIQFQPVVNLFDDEVKGIEALLRWQHKSFGLIPPEQIVDLAEQTALINSLTYWVLENALKKVESLHADGIDVEVSINISVYNLKDQDFVRKIEKIISSYQVPRNSIVLEITESAMMVNPVHATEILVELDKMGLRLAVDDFGTGFSSLAYLKQLPVDELKIDKSFVIGMQNNSSDEVIVRSTIELAHNLGLEVVAEGVENEEVYQKLKNYACDTAQGYFIGKPMPLEKLRDWLKDFRFSRA